MKKNVIVIAAVLMIVGLLAGCAGGGDKVKERRDMPEWYLNPPVAEDVIYGLGQAKLSSDSLSRDTAIARARKDIALQVSARVQTMMTDYAQEAGAEGNSQSITFIETITKQVADVELKGTTTEEVYPAVDGNWYAMVSYPRNAMTDEVADIFVRNEDAAFAEFKADQALEMLEASLEDEPLKSSASAN